MEHGIELGEYRPEGSARRSPTIFLERRDDQAEFEFQDILRLEIAAAVATHDFQLAVDGFDDICG